MDKPAQEALFFFINTARQAGASVWLLTPAGLLTGIPISLAEYIELLKLKKSPDSAVHAAGLPADDSQADGILLNNAVLRNGNLVATLGPALVLGGQVFGWGFGEFLPVN